MKNRKRLIIGVCVFALMVVCIMGGTYAYWNFSVTQENANVIISKCFDLTIAEETGTSINLSNTYPISDEDGSSLDPYVIHLTNKCNNDLTYEMNLEVLPNSTLNEKYLKVMTGSDIRLLNTLNPTSININGASKAYLLESGSIGANSSKDLTLRLWLDGSITPEETDAMSKSFISKVSVIGSINQYQGRYTESILNGTDPVLKDGLIPVTISNDGKVYKADETKEWYSYTNKQWANAVILNDESIEYQNHEEIPESNIESYFVWIPRYRYQIFNDGMYSELTSINANAPQEIKVEFESKEVIASDGVRKGQWLTHPAFTSFDVNGIWVGKFETGYKGSTDKTSAESNTNEPNKVQIKPNVNSWRGIQVANAFYTSYDYKRELDSHMMKNTEWGSVAYLQHSKYGSMNNISMNNNLYHTGFSSISIPTCGSSDVLLTCNPFGDTEDITRPYNTEVGYLASTTGNISGIYDMSGGVYEYVMAVMVDKEGHPVSGKNSTKNSGFNGPFSCPTCDNDKSGLTVLTTGVNFPDTKYYDLYDYGEEDEIYNRRILGDATGEMGPFNYIMYEHARRQAGSWYQDEAWFLDTWGSWAIRGGAYLSGLDAGIFAFNHHAGDAESAFTFRVVLD
jgi:hypothetical protein